MFKVFPYQYRKIHTCVSRELFLIKISPPETESWALCVSCSLYPVYSLPLTRGVSILEERPHPSQDLPPSSTQSSRRWCRSPGTRSWNTRTALTGTTSLGGGSTQYSCKFSSLRILSVKWGRSQCLTILPFSSIGLEIP